MPTIDQLAPATSATDEDEFIVTQSGIARKITRAQVLNGLQPTLTVNSGSLLGRSSTGIGAPEVVTIGANLSFNNGTLSASAVPYVLSALPAGNVPAGSDLISMSQAGANVAVTYSQLLRGFPAIANVDLSQGLVTPTGATTGKKLADVAASMIPLAGGTMTGPLALFGNPALPAQAANKAYIDQSVAAAVPLSGATMSGILTLVSAPLQALDAATKSYADGLAAGLVALSGGSMTGALVLNSDPISGRQAATKQYADTKLSRTGDTLSGSLQLAADPVLALQAATKNYVDGAVGTTLPLAGGTLLGGLSLAADPSSAPQAATKRYVDQRLLRTGDTLTGILALAADPIAAGQAATKNYVDIQVGTAVARSGASMSGALLLASDPATSLQASTKQYADLKIARNGDTLTGALYLAADPQTPLQAATKHYVDSQFLTAVTAAGATFAGPVVLAADPASPLQAATKQYADARVLRSGDTLNGSLSLATDPVMPAQAATKRYVDAQIVSVLPLSGGSLTGILTLSADPTSATQAATKNYVDSRVATTLPLTGGTVGGALSLGTTPTAPAHAATKQYIDGQVASVLPLSGGSLTGSLALSGTPVLPLQAATKSYVDANPNSQGVINVAMPPYGAKLDGVTDDTAAFKAAYLAAPSGSAIYVPNGTTVLQLPGTWAVSLAKKVKWIVDGTVLANGTALAAAIPTGGSPAAFALPGLVVGNTVSGLTSSQAGSAATDFAVNQSSYIVNHNGGSAGAVSTNSRHDTIIYNSPGNYIWGSLDRLIWSGTQTPVSATPAQHVARYVQTLRQAATIAGGNPSLPQPQLWAACLEYRDTTGLPSSAANASLTVEMDWYGNGLDDANNRTIQSLVIGQHNTSGAAVEVSTIIGVYLSSGSSGSAKTIFAIGTPFSNAVLDTTAAVSINSAPAIKLAAGHAIAFDTSGGNKLFYNNTTGILTWAQGSLSYPVGKGITVGWQTVYGSSGTLPSYIAGNIIFLIGSSPYTINLPAASTVAAGTGFTFSVLSAGAVSILPNGSDGIDTAPIVLHIYDRYHIVSDGNGYWREVFRTNAVSPRFSAPIVLPSYTIAALPTGVVAGAKAFASNGRKPSEAAGAGTGVEVFFDGQKWISSCSGAAAAA